MKPFPFRSPQANEIPADLAILGSPSNFSTSIHHVVSQLITSLQPLAVRRNNVLLNDIPRELSVSIDQNMLAYVLTQLVTSAVESTENNCIHIEAILSGPHTTIRVKDLDTHIYHTMDLNADLSA